MRKQPEPGELLSQRIHLNLQEEWQPQLIDNLTKAYDASMAEQFGGEWYAGRRPADDRNTYEFVQSQTDLIDWFTAEKMADPVGAEKLRVKLAATADERFEHYLKDSAVDGQVPGDIEPEALISVSSINKGRNLQAEMVRALQRAVRLGKTFSGCGSSVSAEKDEDDELSSSEQLTSLGYGNRSGSDRFGSLKFKCQNGHENKRPRGKLLSHCQTCGCSVKC